MLQKMEQTKYFFIDYEKETEDSRKLGSKIEESGWVNSSMIIVNCDPDYSSRLIQLINHKLSHLNGNELFECINLNMPYPNMSQVWDQGDLSYKLYLRYLADWRKKNISSHFRYLFLSSDIPANSNFQRLKIAMRGDVDFRIGALYVENHAPIQPEYSIEIFNREIQGDLLFQWENIDNPNYK